MPAFNILNYNSTNGGVYSFDELCYGTNMIRKRKKMAYLLFLQHDESSQHQFLHNFTVIIFIRTNENECL